MTNQLTVIEKKLDSQEIRQQLAAAFGENPESARRFVGSVLAEIKRSMGDKSKDLSVCTPDSIAQSMIDAANFKLAIDGRKHAHLVKRGSECTLQIGVAGYVAKINEHLPDAVISASVMYEGDTLSLNEQDGFTHYSYKCANPMESDTKKIIGAFAVVSFSKAGHRYQKVEAMPRTEIEKIRGKAKFDAIWAEWFTEKAKVAVVRRACKLLFQGIQGMQDIIEYDNRSFDMEWPSAAPDRTTIVDDLNSVIEGKSEEIKEIEINEPKLYKLSSKSATKEYQIVDEWFSDIKKTLDKFDKLEKFASFVKLNHANLEEARVNGAEIEVGEINDYMIQLQEKLQTT